jgi:hypothetical protein
MSEMRQGQYDVGASDLDWSTAGSLLLNHRENRHREAVAGCVKRRAPHGFSPF